MAQRSTNTVREALERLFADVGQMKLLPDAGPYMDFIYQLETAIMDKLREPISQMEAQGLLPPGMSGQPPGAPQPGPQPSAMGGMPMMGGVPQQRGNMPGPAAPNADELSRLLNAGQ